MHAIVLPWSIYWQITITIIIQIGLYFILSCWQTLLFWSVWQKNNRYTENQILFGIYIIFTLALLLANWYFFPLSIFSRPFTALIPKSIIQYLVFSNALAIFILCCFAMYRIVCFKPWFSFTLLLFLFFGLSYHQSPSDLSPPQTLKPNIIIIGIDSLSPGKITKQDTPFLNNFVQKSGHFTDVISPIARTFPAWVTLVTGLDPLHHGARENLQALDNIKTDKSIAWILQNIGYQTVYATDDRRFNNVDENLGFQKIIGPKLGVNDILLGSFYDFPLSNLLINLRIGQWLFPYNYSNRAAHFTYYPSTFNQQLEIDLSKLDKQKPFFIAVHFALLHWPYAWAPSQPAEVNDEFQFAHRQKLYLQALHEVDAQIKKFYLFLQKQGLLQNSIIILLSDHGEALYEKGSRMTDLKDYQGVNNSKFAQYIRKFTATELRKSAGHGSDLLSPEQFKCLLAFRIFANNHQLNPAKKINTRVGLADVAPTIFAFLQMPHKNLDGLSLLPALEHSNDLKKRRFFLESGLLPNAALTNKKAIEYASLLYWVPADTLRLELRPDSWPLINAMKLYGILDGDWLLVLYPERHRYIAVIINLKTAMWTDEDNSLFARTSPREYLLALLMKHFRQQLTFSYLLPLKFHRNL